MKKLYLIRHAKSSWKDFTLDDFDRPLNKRGKHDSKLMGELLKSRAIKPNLIIASPAKRATITANNIAQEIGYALENIEYKESIYEASVRDLITVLTSINDKNSTIFLIGHNPSLNSLLDYLVKHHDIENIVTTGIVEIDFDIEHWNEIAENSGEFVLFEFPKKYILGE
ncbi:MAG: histidine phosphatase family protein [Epsilonproteobacteria bacterium]|nr:histidine phosphatase family protein [Campylobacterota bacterium]